jgi:hypothetical protein
VRRDIDAARSAAQAVATDLVRTLSGSWRVWVDDGFVMSVARDGDVERVALEDAVDDDLWPEELQPGSRRLHEVLLADAAEAVACGVIEVLQLWGVDWPHCPEHRCDTDPWGDVWVCQSDVEHEVPIGDLGA